MINPLVISSVSGSVIPIVGNEVDTDRIVPARFLKEITFDNMGDYLFYDVRYVNGQPNLKHPLNQTQYSEASIMLVENNFGCGSSREHAPQALKRWGINAFVGESFAEIFCGNCIAMGLPCLRVSADDMQTLMAAVESDPAQELVVDLEARKVRYVGGAVAADIADGPREQFIKGNWDSLGQLLDAGDLIGETAAGLPYTNGFVVAG